MGFISHLSVNNLFKFGADSGFIGIVSESGVFDTVSMLSFNSVLHALDDRGLNDLSEAVGLSLFVLGLFLAGQFRTDSILFFTDLLTILDTFLDTVGGSTQLTVLSALGNSFLDDLSHTHNLLMTI